MSKQKSRCPEWQAFFSYCEDHTHFGLPAESQVQQYLTTSTSLTTPNTSSPLPAKETFPESKEEEQKQITVAGSPPVTPLPVCDAKEVNIDNLAELKQFLDMTHIKECLIKPYCLLPDYPLVDSRELMPSFDVDPYEHKEIHGFALVAFQRQLSYFDEVFQYDTLYYDNTDKDQHGGAATALQSAINKNVQVVQQRLQRSMHDELRTICQHKDLSTLSSYGDVLPFLLQLDRGQVMAQDAHGQFRLVGINASFPSDLDTEVKRFGLRMGKFAVGDNELYERNRSFVLQFLMELYGYPIASERRTSAALFSRRLHKLGETFMTRVLGQTDRAITTLYNFKNHDLHYPSIEKIALVSLDADQVDSIPEISSGGYFIDKKRRVVILRVSYTQHVYSPENVRQDRAISVTEQELIHPYTGRVLKGVNILKDTSNMFLRLNDIVRGEHHGRIVYKRQEVIEHTDTDEKRLKFLYAWLVKHQRRFISYSDEYFANVAKVIDGYLFSLVQNSDYEIIEDLSKEVLARFSFIQQARKVKVLEDLKGRVYKGERIGYARMLREASALLHELKFEMVNFFDQHVSSALAIGENMLNDRYLIRTYVEKRDEELSPNGLEIKKTYGRMVGLLDELASIRKARLEGAARQRQS